MRSQMQRFQHWPLMAILLWGLQFSAPAESVAAHHLEGTIHGDRMLMTEDGHVAAVGDLLQVVHGDRVTAHMVFHFKDKSIDDETTVFSQRGNFQLLSYHQIQKGPFFPHPIDLSIDARSGDVVVKSTGKDGKEEVSTEHMNLPPDLCNGMLVTIAKNLRVDESEQDVSMVVATPKPRLVKLAISPKGEEPFSLAGFERKALHYEIKIELGGAAGVVAPLIGKQPPNIQVWIEGGQIPGFVGEEGPICQDGLIVSILQTAPASPAAPHPNEPKTGTAN
jgi:hypothetical protein